MLPKYLTTHNSALKAAYIKGLKQNCYNTYREGSNLNFVSGFRSIQFLFVILKSKNVGDVTPKKKLLFQMDTPTIMMLIREAPEFRVSYGTNFYWTMGRHEGAHPLLH